MTPMPPLATVERALVEAAGSVVVAARTHNVQRVLIEGEQGRHDLLIAVGALIAQRRRQEMQLQQ